MQISEIKGTAEDPTKKAVIQLVKVMSSDFGDRFKQAFRDEEQVKELKQRLYSKLKGLQTVDIYDGYELLVEKKPSFVPTVPEIVEAILHVQKQRMKDEKGRLEAERLSALPPPKAIPDSVARENLKKIRAMLGEACKNMDKPETKAEMQERLVRLEEKRLAHEALLKREVPLYGKTIIDPDHKCAVGWCDRSGTLTTSTSGSATWYCGEHFGESQRPRA